MAPRVSFTQHEERPGCVERSKRGYYVGIAILSAPRLAVVN
jgi:hypothetical protein